MEKLELKHLSMYLPYKLKVLRPDNKTILEVYGIIGNLICHKENDQLTYSGLTGCKPILHPLSDLTPEYLMVDSNLDICDQIELSELMSQKMNFAHLRYGLAAHLFENHFDCFGLIESGLAIDINTLKK